MRTRDLLARFLDRLDVGQQGSEPPRSQYVGGPPGWPFGPPPGAEERAMAARLLDEDIATYGEPAP